MEFEILHCWAPGCSQTAYTLNELHTHHLEAHECPLPDVRPCWAGPARAWTTPPNHRARSLKEWHSNGTRAD